MGWRRPHGRKSGNVNGVCGGPNGALDLLGYSKGGVE